MCGSAEGREGGGSGVGAMVLREKGRLGSSFVVRRLIWWYSCLGGGKRVY